jgi:dimethylsulfoniopropionate demethylase
MTRENNPFEIGHGRFCVTDGSIDYIGRAALQKIAAEGVTREIRGVVFGGDPCPTCAKPWPVLVGDLQIGQITSGIWSPRLKKNIGQSMIDRDFWEPGQAIKVALPDGSIRQGNVTVLPIS